MSKSWDEVPYKAYRNHIKGLLDELGEKDIEDIPEAKLKHYHRTGTPPDEVVEELGARQALELAEFGV